MCWEKQWLTRSMHKERNLSKKVNRWHQKGTKKHTNYGLSDVQISKPSVRVKTPNSSYHVTFFACLFTTVLLRWCWSHNTLLFDRTKGRTQSRRPVRRVCWGGSTYWLFGSIIQTLRASMWETVFYKSDRTNTPLQDLVASASRGKASLLALRLGAPILTQSPSSRMRQAALPLHSRLLTPTASLAPLPPSLSVSPSLSTPNAHPWNPPTTLTVLSIHQHQLLNWSVDEPSDDHRLCFPSFQLRSWTLRNGEISHPHLNFLSTNP